MRTLCFSSFLIQCFSLRLSKELLRLNMLFVYKCTVTGGILMNKFKHMKKILKQCIYQLNELSSLFVINPEKDFTRKRKHLFGDTLMRVLLLEGGSLKDELYKLFGYNLNTLTVSSFIQARDKVKPDAFKE